MELEIHPKFRTLYLTYRQKEEIRDPQGKRKQAELG